MARFAGEIRRILPACPADRAERIAAHACRKYSGRVGRSAAARRFDEAAVLLAVAAHVRHEETGYDGLLARGADRREARAQVHGHVERVLALWRNR